MGRKVKYNAEFKLHCINEVLKNNRSISAVSKENNFDRSNLRKWISFYLHYGGEGILPSRGNEEFKTQAIRELRHEYDLGTMLGHLNMAHSSYY